MATWLKNTLLSSNKDTNDEKNGYEDPKFQNIKFDLTKYARCFLAPVDKKKGELSLCPVGCDNLSKYYSDMVSLIGLAGNGKSTLGSTMYNLMRSDKIDYFAMSDAMASFTQGVWCVNECLPGIDKIGVFDLQGLENENIVHYMVIISVALSKALLLCSINKRFDFSMLKTLATAFDLLHKFNIKLPKPVIYIQAPYKQYSKGQFKIRKDLILDTKGLIKYCKSKDVCPELKDFDIRIFGLPEFDEDEEGRFDSNYTQDVSTLLNDLYEIKEGPRMKERIKYAKIVTKALNSDSPQMVAQLNLFNFKQETQLIKDNIIILHKKAMQDKYGTIALKNKDSFEDFIGMGDFEIECQKYLKQMVNEMKSVPYYDENSGECQNVIGNVIKENKDGKLFINPSEYARPYYDSAIGDLKQKNITKGDNMKNSQRQAMDAFVDGEISKAISKITFNGSTHMPYDLEYKMKKERADFIAKLMSATQNDAQIDDDYLNIDIKAKWKREVSNLETGWTKRKTQAKLDRREVRARNNNGNKCPSCGKKHNTFVGHKKCGDDARWLWCNPPTKHAICDTCSSVQTIQYVCCWSCDARLNTTIVDP